MARLVRGGKHVSVIVSDIDECTLPSTQQDVSCLIGLMLTTIVGPTFALWCGRPSTSRRARAYKRSVVMAGPEETPALSTSEHTAVWTLFRKFSDQCVSSSL